MLRKPRDKMHQDAKDILYEGFSRWKSTKHIYDQDIKYYLL